MLQVQYFTYGDLYESVLQGSEEVGVDPLTYLKVEANAERKRREWEQAELERLQAERQAIENTRAARKEAEPELIRLYQSNPDIANGRYDPHETVQRLGLADTQGNRMWARRRLTDYQRRDEFRRQGAAECQTSAAD